MVNRTLIIACIVATVVCSGGVAYLAGRLAARPDSHSHPHAHDGLPHSDADPAGRDLHSWMHEQLDLSAEQDARLLPHETAFAERTAELSREISAAERALAEAIRQSPREPEAVERELNRLNAAHADLRRLTLDHFLIMEQHLDPGQAGRLRQWTHDSLIRQPRIDR